MDTINFQVESLLDEDETIIWQGRPDLTAFFWNRFLTALPVVIIWAAMDALFFVIVWRQGNTGLRIFISVFIALHALPVWVWLKNVLTTKLAYSNTYYVVTDKRILLRDGLIGYEYKNIYYQNIQDVHLKIGILDRMFGVGDIYLNVAHDSYKKEEHKIVDIHHPENIFAIIQKTARDISTDIYYPNAKRPSENPGYHTSYRP